MSSEVSRNLATTYRPRRIIAPTPKELLPKVCHRHPLDYTDASKTLSSAKFGRDKYQETKKLTAKELVKELQKILKTRKGKDYPLYVWTGYGLRQTHSIEYVHLVEVEDDDDEPWGAQIVLHTPNAMKDADHYDARAWSWKGE
jgi:hypothetical protein